MIRLLGGAGPCEEKEGWNDKIQPGSAKYIDHDIEV